MSPRKPAPTPDIKKIFSAIMCLLIALLFLGSQFTHGFNMARLILGIMCLYFSFAFFRMSRK